MKKQIFIMILSCCILGGTAYTKEVTFNVFKISKNTLNKLQKNLDRLKGESSELKKQNKLFGEWLSDECVILERLLSNIKYDLKRSNRARLRSEYDDFVYMVKEIKVEIKFFRDIKSKLDFTKSINVQDFGATGDGRHDDGPAIRKALKAAVAQKINRIFIPSGKYFIKKSEKGYQEADEQQNDGKIILKYKQRIAHLLVINQKNMVLEGGEDTTLIMGEYETGIGVFSSENITIKNLKIDYFPLAATQGRVVAILDNKIFDVKIDKGFPAPDTRGFRPTPNFVGVSRFFHKDNLPGANVPRTSENSPNQRHSSISARGQDIYRYIIAKMNPPRSTGNFAVGDRIITYARRFGNPAIQFSKSNRCIADSLTVFASPTFAYFSEYSRFTTFVNCKTAIKKDSGRLTSTCADGIMVHGDRLGPYIKNCSLTLLGDDFVNIHSLSKVIFNSSNKKELDIKINSIATCTYRAGDRIGIVEIKKGKHRIKGTAKIKRIAVVYLESQKTVRLYLTFPLNCEINTAKKTGGKAAPDQIVNFNVMSHGFVIRDSSFLYGVSRMFIGGRNGLIKNNTFKDNLNHHELIRIGMGRINPSGGTIFFARNISVENNDFTVNYDKHFIEITDEKATQRNICHLSISGNRFNNYRNTRGFSAIKISNLDRGSIIKNTFIPGRVLHSRYSGSTITERAIEIDDSTNIDIEQNTIESTRKGQIKIADDNKNICVKNNKFTGK